MKDILNWLRKRKRVPLGPDVKLRKRRLEFISESQREGVRIAKLRRTHQLNGTMPEFRRNQRPFTN